jgi:cell division protease FtsH
VLCLVLISSVMTWVSRYTAPLTASATPRGINRGPDEPDGRLRKISIIPRGQALGVTASTPETDRFTYVRDALLAKVKVPLGGRAAEEVVFGDLSTGAEADIQNLTQIARSMVGRWRMSEAIGAVAVADGRQDGLLLPGSLPASPPTQQLVDEGVR